MLELESDIESEECGALERLHANGNHLILPKLAGSVESTPYPLAIAWCLSRLIGSPAVTR
ncbi:MAG: hypothetical protein EAZ24_06090 [Burkholderiales bacterium]|nr:MAG: hypothetical protein EAZ24_06090 [Burkholderiales bacterium]TAG81914.1 MAG: hypothetical protein EAZ21_04755 [Betaproteobacteria bacterium]